jgi:hypothetical protein
MNRQSSSYIVMEVGVSSCPRKMVQRLAGNRMPPKHRQLSSRLWMGQSLHANPSDSSSGGYELSLAEG